MWTWNSCREQSVFLKFRDTWSPSGLKVFLFSVFSPNEAKQPMWTQFNENLLLKYGFYAESVNFVMELYTDCFLHANCTYVEARSAKFSTCFLSGEGRAALSTLWGPCVEAGSQTPHSYPFFYTTADKPDVSACLNSMGADPWRFLLPLQRLLPPCESGLFYNLSQSAPSLFYSYPRLQRAFYDLFHNAFPTCFGERAENPIYDKVHSHHSITEYAQLEGTPRIIGPTLGTAKDGKYLMWFNL